MLTVCAPLRDNQATIRFTGECGDRAFDLVGISLVKRTDQNPEQRCHGLDRAKLTYAIRNLGIPENTHAGHPWRNVLEQL
jgi:hypothetical protein